jgi:hypothetical protein
MSCRIGKGVFLTVPLTLKTMLVISLECRQYARLMLLGSASS